LSTTRFRRDYKREKSAPHGKKLNRLLQFVLDLLIADQPLPERYRIVR
jgi:mRNA interferase YafQ